MIFQCFGLKIKKSKQTAELFTFENCKQTAENVNKKVNKHLKIMNLKLHFGIPNRCFQHFLSLN